MIPDHYSNIWWKTLRMSRADESYIRQVKRLEMQDLLIIVDFGMQPLDEMS
jgi:hypothetical protein